MRFRLCLFRDFAGKALPVAVVFTLLATSCPAQRNGVTEERNGDTDTRSNVTEAVIGATDSLPARIRFMTEESMRLHTLESARGLRLGREALRLARELGDSILMLRAHNAIGASRWIRGEYDLAVRAHLAALDLAEATGSLPDIGACNSNLGLMCRTIGMRERSEEYLRAAIRIRQEIGDEAGHSRSRMNLGLLFAETGRYDSARVLHEASLAWGRKVGDSLTIARNLHYLGRVERATNRMPEAEKLVTESLRYFDQIRDRNGRSLAAADLADILLATGQIANARRQAELALREALALGSRFAIREAAHVLSRIHEQTGAFREALRFARLAADAADSLYNREASLHLAQATLSQQIAKREGLWKLRERRKQLEWESSRQSERLVRNVLLIGASLLFVILLILLFAYRAKQRSTKLIAGQKRHIDEANSKLRLEVETRQRMLSIIGHDLFGPMGAAEGMLQLAADETLGRNERDELVGSARATVSGSVTLLRTLVSWARAQERDLTLSLEAADLMEVLRPVFDLAASVGKSKGLRMSMQGPEEFPLTFDRQVITVLVENLLSNAVKFTGEGGSVSMEVERGETDYRIRIRDTGRGMPKDLVERIRSGASGTSQQGSNREKGHGLGLDICRRLTALHHGELSVESEPGVGSTFTLRLPLDPAAYSRNVREDTTEPVDSSI
ncbi:MAG: tetratricopeptide repeat protein [Bacteroidetes bacterium]|nr:tetratricopeptide repeat protein [Bacteroidota bacterium]